MALPPTLYKYRDWNNSYHRRILSNSELFFANNKAFNDPYDFDLPFKDIFPFDRELFKKEAYEQKGMRLSDEDLNEMENKWPIGREDWPENWKVFNENAKNKIRNLENKMGVFCGCEKNTNPLMWAHYADAHKGFCVGFDIKKLSDFILMEFTNENSIIKEVKYDNKIPVLNSFADKKNIDYQTDRITTKSIHWEYEKEHRIIIKNYNNKTLLVDNEIYKEIIFGLRMDPVSEFEIKAICKIRFPHIKFYKAKINAEEFKVDIEPCE